MANNDRFATDFRDPCHAALELSEVALDLDDEISDLRLAIKLAAHWLRLRGTEMLSRDEIASRLEKAL